MDVPDFGVIYTEYFSDVYKYMLSLCRNRTIAEEITQESFFKAMQHIDRFNGNCTLLVLLGLYLVFSIFFGIGVYVS